MPKNTQFTVARGETFSLPVTLTKYDGEFIDITNYSFTGSIKETYKSDDVVSFTITKLNPPSSGSFDVFLDTVDLHSGKYVYSIFAASGNYRRVLLEGNFIIRESTL